MPVRVEELDCVFPPAQWDGDGDGAFPVAKLAPSPYPAAIEKSLDVETLVEGRHAPPAVASRYCNLRRQARITTNYQHDRTSTFYVNNYGELLRAFNSSPFIA